jgi:hypothetical protein
MSVKVGDWVMHPAYAPYPRYGRVVRFEDGDRVAVTQVHCGDPRCNAEHSHADQTWRVPDLASASVYQPRASWELGRKNSANAPVWREPQEPLLW